MIQTVIGRKINQTQRFLSDGRRIPITIIEAEDTSVVQAKTQAKDHYTAVQLGFGTRKISTRSILGHIKKASLTRTPLFIKEVRMNLSDEESMPQVGTILKVTDILKPGDIIQVTGISKGKGFAGSVKRHGFRGGPRTHGQSDRERAPGSIGQTTTPGRVYRGKRMAGRMGQDTVTLHNLEVIACTETPLGAQILVKGLVPGATKSIVVLSKTGENKKFIALFKEPEAVSGKTEEKEKTVDEPVEVSRETASSAAREEKTEVKEEAMPNAAEEENGK